MNPAVGLGTQIYHGYLADLIHLQAEEYHHRRKIKNKGGQEGTGQADQPGPDVIVDHGKPGISSCTQNAAVGCHLITGSHRGNGENRDKLPGQLGCPRGECGVNTQNRPLGQIQDNACDNPDGKKNPYFC